MNKVVTHCGFFTIVGKPNVGKSTLLNALCEKKISIISRKSQTTRHRITAIKTVGTNQFVFIDTPGLHRRPKHKINHLMIRTALTAAKGVDVLLFVLSSKGLADEDKMILTKLARFNIPIIVIINKCDLIKPKTLLLELINHLQELAVELKIKFASIVPISAKKQDGLRELENSMIQFLEPSPFFFPADQNTDRPDQFIAAELIREKLMRFLGEELPHCNTVTIEKFEQVCTKKIVLHIHGTIWVERKGQKKIIIGTQGEHLKKIATLARKDLEHYFMQPVFLQLWVKVKKGWTDNLQLLHQFGYSG